MRKRIVCGVLAAVMVLTMVAGFAFRAGAAPNANVQKQQKTRTISVVFDNSGSMYFSGAYYDPKAWCRATYAMEVFAAMLNEGDRMEIHPMNPCYLLDAGKEEGNYSGGPYLYGTNPLIINGPEDASLIRKLYIEGDGGTPIESIKPAYDSLLESDSDEKWLVVVTDGNVFTEYGVDLQSKTAERLEEVLGECTGVKVMYLGIGSNPAKPSGTVGKDRFYADGKQILPRLTEMCNIIFERDALKSITPSSRSVDTSISMDKLIIFAQGDVTNVAIDGGKRVDMQQVRYSERGNGTYDYGSTSVDTDLKGVIVTYASVPKGNYPLQVEGGTPTSLEIYYEPGVDLQVQLQDEAGNPVDPNAELPPGKYYIDYALYDTVTGERITDTSLLGDVNYHIAPLVNDQEVTGYSGGKDGRVELELKDGDTLNGNFDVTYLGDYSIHKTGDDIGWPNGGIKIVVPPAGSLVLSVSGGKDTYDLMTLEEQAVYHYTVTYDGAQLSGSDLSAVDFQVTLTGGNARYETRKTEDGFEVCVKYNTSAVDTQPGAYELVAKASFVNQDGLTATAPDAIRKFTLEDNSGKLEVNIDVVQDFYALTSMDDAKPVYIYLNFNGAPVDAQRFADTKLELTVDSLEKNKHYTLQEDAANARYVLSLVDSDALRTGEHKIIATVTGTDELGREITAKDTAEFEIQPYPLWMRILFWVLVILAILGLIWAYLNKKVLPKRIDIERCVFRVGNKEVSGEAECNYGGGGKRRGYLEINPPYFGGAPSASSCGISLELVAVSPRRTPSSKRFVGIRGAVAGNEGGTDRMKFGGTTLVKNAEGNFVRMGTTTDTVIEDDVDSGFPICVYASVPGPRGRKVSVSLDVRTQFY